MSLFSTNLFASELGQLTPQQLRLLQQQQTPLVVDIRTIAEWDKTGLIPESHPLQFFDPQGGVDAEKWLTDLKKLQKTPEQAIVIVCNSGKRSDVVGKMLTEQLKMDNIYHLSAGIQQWLRLSQPVVNICTVLQNC